MDLFTNGLSLDAVLELLKRRLWIAVSLFLLVITVTISLIVFLPSIYTATAYILVEGQQIPPDYIRSTVTMGVERRLQAISQEILSRSRLEKLVEQFRLYEDLKSNGASNEAILSALRRDIGIRFGGRDTVSFQVSYTNPEQSKVAPVANALASLYIEENLKIRGFQSLTTSGFLRSELEVVKKKLEEQEQLVSQYKQQHMGELPEQLDANLGTLASLQKQLEIVSANLAQARQRRSLLKQQIAEASASSQADVFSADPRAIGLGTLRQKLGELQLRFSDKHPDVILLKQIIANLEQQTAQKGGTPHEGGSVLSPIEAELAAVDAEIQRLTSEVNKTQGSIAVYQQRVESAPQREQEMIAISRDYTNTRELYASLLKRLQEAELAESLEQNQKAERFRLLEPAVPPHAPSGPQRVKLFVMGLLASLGAAGGGVLLRELLDTSFHRVEDLRAFTDIPILGSAPQIVTKSDLRQGRLYQWAGLSALAALVCILVGTSYWFAHDNESLVRTLYKPPSGIQFR